LAQAIAAGPNLAGANCDGLARPRPRVVFLRQGTAVCRRLVRGGRTRRCRSPAMAPHPEGGRIIVDPLAPRHVLALAAGLNAGASTELKTAPSPRKPASGSAVVGSQRHRGGEGLRRRPRSCPTVSVEARSVQTLFSGSRVCTNPNQKRSSATVFRRPAFSTAPPHQRPVFAGGKNGLDGRVCVDYHDPARFTSGERARFEVVNYQQHGRRPASALATPSAAGAPGVRRDIATPSSTSSGGGGGGNFQALWRPPTPHRQ